MSVLLLFIFIIRLISSITTDTVSIIELLNWGALAYMAFIISYLYPQFKHKDERTKAIKQKGTYYSICIVLFVLIVLTALMQFNIVILTSIELIRILVSVIIISIWTSWFFLSKQM
ncbi:hypothetical protein ACS127_12280 [Amphibacillus sp. Q70]|uniref:hypothetical protein n=1 Tax=Amphibacillus sp. Q70 TaxID=3453416 RepID=UPI003F87CC73